MILPTTASAVWIVAILAFVCLGSWANTLKLASKWRFEYFYCDLVFGLLLSAGVAALALGSAHPQDLTLQDNLLLTGYRKMAWAFGSGIVLNLGTLLLLGSMTLSGMSVAFPLTLGVALAIGTVWDLAGSPRANMTLTFLGLALFLAAVAVTAFAHVWRRQDYDAASETALRPDPRLKPKRARTPSAALAIILAVAAGIVLGLFPQVLGQATGGENGMAPYAATLLLAAGAFFSAPVFVLFFATFPLAGAPATVRGYLDGTRRQHFLGVAGGVAWTTGLLGSLMVSAAAPIAQFSGVAQYLLGRALSEAALLLAAAWGLLVWREFRGTSTRVHMLIAAMLILFLAGLGVVGVGFPGK
jgi:glucose uptake protein